MKFRKIYLEISNICNLNCTFCPGTIRTPRAMTAAEFSSLLPKLRPWTDFLYFHLMGEPLLHPQIGKFLALAAEHGFRVILTTNGTLLPQCSQLLLSSPAVHKVNISLHSFEANSGGRFNTYLDGCFSYAREAAGKKITVFRLWNQGGADRQNEAILDAMALRFPRPWVTEPRGTRIADRVYLEFGDKFDWPALSAPENNGRIFCYGLRDQLGILCDGTVVPCCLDSDGNIPLGNAFTEDLTDILARPAACEIHNGFTRGHAAHPLCRHCGFARRFG